MPMEKNFDAATAEPRLSAAWEAAGAFRAGANATRDETFSIMIPPPNVTGALHMGHAFNNTLQDILTRWHRMRGFDTLWQPGTDHAGIATQMVVERELAKEGNITRRDMGREEFVKRVWQQKQKSRGNIRGQLERLGASCDWSREAFTMSGAPGAPEGEEGNFHDAVIKVFVELYNKGLIYRGKRLVNWDPHFETAISDLEVEQTEVDGHMWRLRYPLADGETFEYVEKDEDGTETLRETRDYLTVATTRPETMLGDTGVAVHPDDSRYAHLIGKHVVLPIVGRRIPIVADSYADPAKGTGAVKITPAHDFNDWDVGQRTGLRVINVMSTRAEIALSANADFAEGCPEDLVAAALAQFDGRDRYEVRDQIVTIAEADGWLDGIDADRHMVPHGDRSKTAIEPFLTHQWFVDTARIVQPAIDAVRNGDTVILPEQDAKVYFHWLENIEPWCISRQLWWGHQIPVWYGPELAEDGTFTMHGLGKEGDRQYCAASEEEAMRQAFDVYQLPIWLYPTKREALEDFLKNAASDNPADPYVPMWRDEDVLDTWFSSGLWPLGTLGWPEQTPELEKYFPTSVLVTGFDIIFFWVARMMMMQTAVLDQALPLSERVPFRHVYVHALVRDEKGKKMSKSLGNVLDPLDLVDEFGADAVRFTLTSMAAMGRDLKLSTQRIAGYRNFGTKLWNAARFAEMNEALAINTPTDAIPQATATVNRWILGETARVREEVDAALTAFRFNDAANALYAFVWGKVCDWYVEFAKPLLQGEDETHKVETQAVMAWVIDQCMILLHPIMPFITEELWGTTGDRAKMLVHAEWPTYTAATLADPEADAEMGWVIGLIDQVRSARAQMHVPAGLLVPMVHTGLDAAARGAWERNETLIKRLARIDSLTEVSQLPKGAITIAVPGGTLGLPLADIIDVAEEKARLEKSLGKLEKEIKGLSGRVSNPKFVASAPEEVVEEARANLAEREGEAEALRAALTRLAELG